MVRAFDKNRHQILMNPETFPLPLEVRPDAKVRNKIKFKVSRQTALVLLDVQHFIEDSLHE